MDYLLKYYKNTQRFIKIHVGRDADEQVYHVPEAALELASDYFLKALKHESSMGGEKGLLRFPADNADAWKVLLYWILKGALPEDWNAVKKSDEQQELHMVRCWAMGEKYLLPDFQDVIMLELLKYLDSRANPKAQYLTLAAAKEGFATTPAGRPLRRLIALDLAECLREGHLEYDMLCMFDGIGGAMSEVVQAVAEYGGIEENLYRLCAKNHKTPEEAAQPWRAYMVGGGPTAHWVYESAAEEEEDSKRYDRRAGPATLRVQPSGCSGKLSTQNASTEVAGYLLTSDGLHAKLKKTARQWCTGR
ncbi:hypothetical protein LTR53_004936 [Teratosphaeriaceae sp. CCFEE 6253]|nr:hypothetical protein LTR53_004936 [Teratosphaeriaceae sp. CCFEE 6253]